MMISKTINFINLCLELFEQFSLTAFNQVKSFENINREQLIPDNLRLDYVNEKEKYLITNLYLTFFDIFYLRPDKLSFSNRIKHFIDTNNSKPIFTETHRYSYVHKQEMKSEINKIIYQGINQPSISPW